MVDEEIGFVTWPIDDPDTNDVMTLVSQDVPVHEQNVQELDLVDGQLRGDDEGSLDGPRSEIPRAGKVQLIEHNGEPRRVRQVSEVMISFISPEKCLEAKQNWGSREEGDQRKTIVDHRHSRMAHCRTQMF
ncbi:hypothetical protein V6N11_063212 [Hibiscus sabdariffa]|uniref:Uncharacterized protein n=2 Tax=Hibiscus sabdariffa TaxID=183260 RepID=A0ABR2NX98_9ROSI